MYYILYILHLKHSKYVYIYECVHTYNISCNYYTVWVCSVKYLASCDLQRHICGSTEKQPETEILGFKLYGLLIHL